MKLSFARMRDRRGIDPDQIDWLLPHFSSNWFRQRLYRRPRRERLRGAAGALVHQPRHQGQYRLGRLLHHARGADGLGPGPRAATAFSASSPKARGCSSASCISPWSRRTDAGRRHSGDAARAGRDLRRPRADAGGRYPPRRDRRPRRRGRDQARRLRCAGRRPGRGGAGRASTSASMPGRSRSSSTSSSRPAISASARRATRLSPLARKWLVSDSPQSLHNSMLLRVLEWQAIDTTEDFVRTGKALDVHDIIRGDQWTTYQRGMRSLARLTAGEVVRRVKLPEGADGDARHRRRPRRLFGRLLPRASGAPRHDPRPSRRRRCGRRPSSPRRSMGSRVVHRAGDALNDDFGDAAWDLVFIAQLVHHFDAATNAAIVRHAADGAQAQGPHRDPRRAPPGIAQRAAARPGRCSTSILRSPAMREPGRPTRSPAGSATAGLKPARPIHLRTAPGVSVMTAARPG